MAVLIHAAVDRTVDPDDPAFLIKKWSAAVAADEHQRLEVGQLIGDLVTQWIPMDQRLVAVATYCLGMAGFTMIMGNAFAAFPVMTAGIGLPIVIQKFGGDPAAVCAIGMLSGFCGTLMTPLAANFNLVPAALLELPDRYAVIKAQIPTALPLLIGNMLVMYAFAFH